MTIIEKLSIKSYDKIIELWEKSNLSYKPKGRESFEFLNNRLKTSPTWIFGIFDENKQELIGVVIVSHDGQRGWINRLAIDPSYRRNGYGKMLIQYAINYLKSQGIYLWAALIENENKVSQELFQNQGFNKHDDIIYYSKRESKSY